MKPGWSGSVELGLNGSEGNSSRVNVRAGLGAERKTEETETTFSFVYTYAKDDGEESENQGQIDLRNDWLLGKDSPWRIYALGRVEYDTFQNWDWRVSAFAGVGYEFIKTDKTTLIGRFGAGAANPGGRESGLLNFGGEFLTPRIATLSDRIANAFVPRFHLGSSLNLNGTQYAYAGATWTIDISQAFFVEASLGAALNNGKTGAVVPENRLNLGCNTGARGAASLGYRLNDRWSLIATMEHFSASNCSDNLAAGTGSPRGPSNFGAKLGYTF